jgi:hypothetical protein
MGTLKRVDVKKIMGSAPPERERVDYPQRLDCRQEAQSIRAMASAIKNPNVREQLFLIASLYDQLADLSDRAVPALEIDSMTGRTDAL